MSQNKIQFIRVAGVTLKTEITPKEKKYRETEFPDDKKILKKSLICTSCGKDVKDKIISQTKINIHPVLEVIWCKKCEDFYEDGEFSVDEDGSDKYCRWCAQGGELYCCSYCSVAFCSKCVRRNLPRKIQKSLDDDDWRCFVCVSEPLWPLRALCDAAKRYVEARQKTKKPTRALKVEEVTEGDTTESEVSTRRSKRRKPNNKESTEDKQQKTDSDEKVSEEKSKIKRKYASSSEEPTAKKRGRRSKTDDEEIQPHPDEKNKEIYEAIVTETLSDCGALRRILSKKEANLKKEHTGVDVLKLNECIDKADEDFREFFKDAKTSLEIIEKNYEAKIASLRKARADEKSKDDSKSETTTSENDTITAPEPASENVEPEKENETVDEPDANKNDDTVDDIMEIDSTVAQNASPQSSRKSSVASVNGKADEPDNMSIVIDDDANLDKTEIDKSKSVSDSLAVNVDSIVDSLRTDESQVDDITNANKIFDDTTVSDIDLTIDMPAEKNDLTENNVDLETETNTENKIDESIESTKLNESAPLSPLNKDKIAKQALLQSSSDNASSSENDNVKKKSSDSDISGVSVLHSDSNTNNSKQKKLKKRKSLDKLNSHSAKKDKNDVLDKDKEIDRLINLNSLKKRPTRSSSSEGHNSEKENVSKEKKKNLSSSKKKKQNVSIVEYFSDGSGSDTDDSKISLSKFNSYLENKQKSFLDGTTEQLSKKVLLDFSSDEENQKDESIQEDSPTEDSPKKPIKKEKLGESKKKPIQISSDEESEKEKKSKKNDKKSKWRQDAVLRGKLSETDTSDEERLIQRQRLKEQIEAEKTLIKTENSSDSEELFRPKKRSVTAKKRKTKLTSSGSEFELKEDEDSDDSVQIISDSEKPASKNKKRRRIKRLDDSNSSAEEDEDVSKTPGSASKGRKNIRKVLQEEDLAELTVRTAKEEAERKKRIADKQALYNDSFQMEEGVDKQLSKLVLDFDPKTKEELVSVHSTLIKKLKPHQAKGVKFMWDSCYESVKMARTTPGGGCILAHCMGLGKTLQVITLIHTVMRYPELNVNRVLIICPLSTVLNWVAEFEMWLQDVEYGDDINVFNLSKCSNPVLRADCLNNWFNQGGVMILGYEMFRNLVNTGKVRKKIKQYYLDTLLDPGPDLVVCDEGHMLKNEASALSQATMKIKTLRRIVLTGTPLQNNLKEYHCMVQFIKPNLLGDRKEFLNRFANPITNGQYSDSTTHDVRVMKRRAHVLHKMLDGVVQRMDYNVLTPFLPAKHEFVILIALSDLQAKLYQHYIDTYSKKFNSANTTLFKDYQIMRLIWTHPYAMKLGEDRKRKLADKKNENDDDSEGSLKDFVINSSEESASGSESGDKSDSSVVSINSDDGKKKANKSRMTRAMKKDLGLQDEDLYTEDIESAEHMVWWKSMISEEEMKDYRMGPKIVLLFAILRQCESIGDKLLVFSQSIPSLDMIEYFLDKWDTMEDTVNDKTETPFGTWEKGLDYFRLDGQTPTELRTMYTNRFNKTSNLRARLFLISTKAGGLGINLTAANRVIIFDASWNPSYDVQSIFRIYRFGQNKPCYIYRFLAQGTMEEKIYERQVTKLSISCRVVDEQQIDRHFNTADVVALYEFNRKMPSLGEVPKLPKDRLMAELLKEYKHAIVSYHEHDSLLENIAEEELTEEERKQAWEDYENEKKGLNLQPQPTLTAAQADFMFNKGTIMAALKKEHPDVSETQLQVMYGMVRDKLRQHYTDQIRMQQMQQMRNAQMSNVGNPGIPANPTIAALMQQRQAVQQMQQMQQMQQNSVLRQHLEQQARDRLEQSNKLGNSAAAKPTSQN